MISHLAGALLVWTLHPAFAEDTSSTDSPPPSDSSEKTDGESNGDDSAVLTPEAMTGAEAPASISRRELDRLEPRSYRLPQNPYIHTDFTAYTLEWGETRIGPTSVRVGVLPRTQVGTVPAALALGILNGHAKVNALRLGPVDLAGSGSYYGFSKDGFSASNLQLGSVMSVRVVDAWSFHIGGKWSHTVAKGVPDISSNPWLIDLIRPQLPGEVQMAQEAGLVNEEDIYSEASSRIDSHLLADALTIKFATDYRFNRRDSIIFQAQANVASAFESTIAEDYITDDMRYAQMALDVLQANGIAETWITSVAWHFSWHRVDLRLGAGLSATPGAWLTQTADFAWRFGGPSRMSQTRMNHTWKDNRRDVKRADRTDAPSPDAPR